MSCPDCLIAETNPKTGHFGAGCCECDARAIAGSPEHAEAAKAHAITPDYRSALQKAFGADWASMHERVKHYAEKLA